jgi:cytochrome c5
MRSRLASLVIVVAACRSAAPTPAPVVEAPAAPSKPVDRWTDDELLAEGRRYLEEPAYRRKALEGSLVNPTNTYSRQRLDAYGRVDRGWDLLPEWNPKSAPIVLGKTPSIDPSAPSLWDGKRPTTMAAWIALGREVFLGYPLRKEVFMSFALERRDLAERVGIRVTKEGVVPGARAFIDVDGKSTVGITCAVCHSNVTKEGDLVIGEARRSFDYGTLRLAYHAETKTHVEPDLARRMRTWGPGRADVTEDDDEDPVAIPDLWGLKHQTFLTQAGTIKHATPIALAIRQETQLLHSNHQKVRPPRELAFALAMFLYSLEPPRSAADRNARGEELFKKQCSGCHSNDAFGGDPIKHEKIGTDRALATGGARGTGNYRPPALLRVVAAAPYFHQGAVPTLADVLSPERLEASYARSPLGKGAVAGHAFGTDLPPDDRRALVSFLESL